MPDLINCPECGADVSRKAKSCPKCGKPFLKGMNAWWLVLIAIGVIVAAFAFLAGETLYYSP
jgi:predicted amidophosphoribosyltransferase